MKEMDLNYLPPEILPHIFKFLPLPDRKCVRLTCKLWKDACSRPNIIKREKFVLRLEYNDIMGQMNDFALKCVPLSSNFEFHGISLRLLSSNWWEIFGDRLKSLILYKCNVDEKTLADIISHCSNLTMLSIRPHETRTYSEDILDDLIAQKVEQKNLESLNLYAITVSNEWCQKLFVIYPNIRTLSKEKTIVGGMEFPPLLENFTYWIKSSSLWMVPLCQNTKLKFKVLDIPVDLRSISRINVVKNFLSSQLELEKIELTIFSSKNMEEELKALLLFMLKNLPNLKELVFRGIDFHFSASEFDEFSLGISHLESFTFFNSLYCPLLTEVLLWPKHLIMFNNLTKLQLPFYQEGLSQIEAERMCLAILSRCGSLRCLCLGMVTNKILENILEMHTELRALSLDFSHKQYQHFFTTSLVNGDTNLLSQRKGNSFSQLRNLEHLEIRGLSCPNTFDNFLSEFKFPRLKCFHFISWINKKDPIAGISGAHRLLGVVSGKAPSLEYLELRSGLSNLINCVPMSTSLSVDELKECFKHLKYLRFFFTDSTLYTDTKEEFLEGARELIIECPSLTYVTNLQLTFTYDRLSRTFKCYPSSYLNFPCSKPSNFY